MSVPLPNHGSIIFYLYYEGEQPSYNAERGGEGGRCADTDRAPVGSTSLESLIASDVAIS